MIDKEQPLDVCKIETKKQIDHRIEHDSMSKTKALKVVAEESGIPYNTLKQWFYPKSNDNRKYKRRKEKVLSTKSGGELGTNVPSDKSKLKKILEQISIKELQDVVSKAAIISKEVGADQSVATILNLGLYMYQKQ